MPLHEIVYVSLAVRPMDQTELMALLDESRRHNEACGVTGALVYYRHEFLQLLEGEREVVDALYDAIRKDPRHQQVYTVWDGPLQVRSFDRWSMGFVSPDDAALRAHPGYESVLTEGLGGAGKGSSGKKILMKLRDDFLCTT